MKSSKVSFFAIVLSTAISVASAQQSPPQAGTARQNSPQMGTGETDNSKMNERDREQPRLTADQQSENEADRDLTASIRKSITDDKAMSVYGKNVKIISQNGMVTLKGPVRSDTEKGAIEAAAKKIAGAAKVKSEITVEPESR